MPVSFSSDDSDDGLDREMRRRRGPSRRRRVSASSPRRTRPVVAPPRAAVLPSSSSSDDVDVVNERSVLTNPDDDAPLPRQGTIFLPQNGRYCNILQARRQASHFFGDPRVRLRQRPPVDPRNVVLVEVQRGRDANVASPTVTLAEARDDRFYVFIAVRREEDAPEDVCASLGQSWPRGAPINPAPIPREAFGVWKLDPRHFFGSRHYFFTSSFTPCADGGAAVRVNLMTALREPPLEPSRVASDSMEAQRWYESCRLATDPASGAVMMLDGHDSSFSVWNGEEVDGGLRRLRCKLPIHGIFPPLLGFTPFASDGSSYKMVIMSTRHLTYLSLPNNSDRIGQQLRSRPVAHPTSWCTSPPGTFGTPWAAHANERMLMMDELHPWGSWGRRSIRLLRPSIFTALAPMYGSSAEADGGAPPAVLLCGTRSGGVELTDVRCDVRRQPRLMRHSHPGASIIHLVAVPERRLEVATVSTCAEVKVWDVRCMGGPNRCIGILQHDNPHLANFSSIGAVEGGQCALHVASMEDALVVAVPQALGRGSLMCVDLTARLVRGKWEGAVVPRAAQMCLRRTDTQDLEVCFFSSRASSRQRVVVDDDGAVSVEPRSLTQST